MRNFRIFCPFLLELLQQSRGHFPLSEFWDNFPAKVSVTQGQISSSVCEWEWVILFLQRVSTVHKPTPQILPHRTLYRKVDSSQKCSNKFRLEKKDDSDCLLRRMAGDALYDLTHSHWVVLNVWLHIQGLVRRGGNSILLPPEPAVIFLWAKKSTPRLKESL